jgi:hypothetical protein
VTAILSVTVGMGVKWRLDLRKRIELASKAVPLDHAGANGVRVTAPTHS